MVYTSKKQTNGVDFPFPVAASVCLLCPEAEQCGAAGLLLLALSHGTSALLCIQEARISLLRGHMQVEVGRKETVLAPFGCREVPGGQAHLHLTAFIE